MRVRVGHVRNRKFLTFCVDCCLSLVLCEQVIAEELGLKTLV